MPGKGHPVFDLVNMLVLAGDFRKVLPRKLARIALWYNVRRKKLWYAEIEKNNTPQNLTKETGRPAFARNPTKHGGTPAKTCRFNRNAAKEAHECLKNICLNYKYPLKQERRNDLWD